MVQVIIKNIIVGYDSNILKEVGAKTTYYKWSGVSGCLSAVPASKVIHVEINESKNESFINNFLEILIARHSLKYPKLENRNFVVSKIGEENTWQEHDGIVEIGEPDSVSKIFSGLTSFLDMNDSLSVILWEMGAWCTNNLLEERKDDGGVQISKKGISFLTSISLFLITELPIIIKIIPILISCVLFLLLTTYFYEKYIKDDVYNIINQLKEIYTDCTDYLDDIRKKFSSWYNSINESLKQSINPGYSYAIENPYIKVNTDLLKEYGYQLSNINDRLIKADGMIKSLYTKVGFSDLFSLIQADFYTGFDLRINKCKNYLIDTADDFERAENNIIMSTK